jgi:nicotinamidase-related amidase
MKHILSSACALLATLVSAYAADPAYLHTPVPPAPLHDSVVLIIDAQREYVDGHLPLTGMTAALAQTQRLLVRARAAHVPIIHVQHIGTPGARIFAADGSGIMFAQESTPMAGETVIVKHQPNSFAGTTLADVLQSLGRKHLVISGYMTHMCVSTTARSALEHGFQSTVIAGACATRDLPDGHGGTLPAAILQHTALAELADAFATIVDSVDEIPD